MACPGDRRNAVVERCVPGGSRAGSRACPARPAAAAAGDRAVSSLAPRGPVLGAQRERGPRAQGLREALRARRRGGGAVGTACCRRGSSGALSAPASRRKRPGAGLLLGPLPAAAGRAEPRASSQPWEGCRGPAASPLTAGTEDSALRAACRAGALGRGCCRGCLAVRPRSLPGRPGRAAPGHGAGPRGFSRERQRAACGGSGPCSPWQAGLPPPAV